MIFIHWLCHYAFRTLLTMIFLSRSEVAHAHSYIHAHIAYRMLSLWRHGCVSNGITSSPELEGDGTWSLHCQLPLIYWLWMSGGEVLHTTEPTASSPSSTSGRSRWCFAPSWYGCGSTAQALLMMLPRQALLVTRCETGWSVTDYRSSTKTRSL